MEFVFATNNRHKVEEVEAMLEASCSLLSLADINCTEEIPETADSLEGNALIKAHFVCDQYGMNVFADDTGLEVEALGGAPGVYSARYAGEPADAQANMEKLLLAMEGVENRAARFRTVIALVMGGKEYLFEGCIEGTISHTKMGDTGFGYDPIFVPNGYDASFAELGEEVKNRISHRAIAIGKLRDFLYPGLTR